MRTLIFDLESDGLLDKTTQIHCICIADLMAGRMYEFNDQPEGRGIQEGLAMLQNADTIVGHNIVGFDIPVIRKLFPSWYPKGVVRDTILLTRLIWPDLKERDFGRLNSAPDFPKNLIGSHSLKAWGYRIGLLKGDFKENNNFDEWSQEMQDYCVQDVKVTLKLWKAIEQKKYAEPAIELEHKFGSIIEQQERHGFLLDQPKAMELVADLTTKRAEIEDRLQKVFQPEVETMKKTKWNFNGETYRTKAEATTAAKAWAKENKTTQKEALAKIEKGEPLKKKIPFNPGSRDQIAKRFMQRGWKPTDFTPDGRARVDEPILKELAKDGYEEAGPLLEYLMIQKRLGQLAEGNEAWLKLVKADGRLHGRVTTNGAVTGRCTHSKPNLAQVPNAGSPYGKECRELFTVGEGKKLVGCDASGLELRCLAHYMARYDGGAYAKILLEEDIHTANQKAAGLPTRDNAKTFIYAFLYGAGDEKIGKIIGKGQAEGKSIKKEFLDKTPALKKLREAVEQAVDARGYLVGLDGRQLPIRSSHAALNTLLQSAGALIMKQATVLLNRYLEVKGWSFARDYALVGHIHDEMQLEVDKDKADTVGQLAVKAIQDAGRSFNFRCRLDGEYKVGQNWSETH
jgi:DNA polymerase I-like protein with 3'-5' exonuclease and polymerase domains